jgi:hypothetical protein
MGAHATLIFAAGAIVMASGFMLRYDFVKLGTKDEHPMRKLGVLYYGRATTGATVKVRPQSTRWVEAPVALPEVAAPVRMEHPLLEVAFSVFRVRPGEAARSRARVLLALYRSWRRPVRFEYTPNVEGA